MEITHVNDQSRQPLCRDITGAVCHTVSFIRGVTCHECLVMLDDLFAEDMVDMDEHGMITFPEEIEMSSVRRFIRHLEENDEKTFLMKDAIIVAKRTYSFGGHHGVSTESVLKTLKDAGFTVKHVDKLPVKKANLGGCFGFNGLK